MALMVKTLDEIELKYVVSKFDRDMLPNPTCLYIEQSYLKDGSNLEKRVRRTVDLKTGDVKYQLFIKGERKGIVRRETVSELDEPGYAFIKNNDADPECAEIRKRRYVFEHADHTFEIDVFSDLDLVLMEIELDHVGQEVKNLPPYVTIEGEVTHNDAYYNRAIAKRIKND